MSVKAGTIKLPGLRAAAKLTKGAKFQRRMRADAPAVRTAPGQDPGAAGDSDNEFAPPDAAALARMRARLAGELEDDMADV